VIQITAPTADVLYAMSVISNGNPAFADGGQVLELETGAEAAVTMASVAASMVKYRAPGEVAQ
jgi:hypothetical protein